MPVPRVDCARWCDERDRALDEQHVELCGAHVAVHRARRLGAVDVRVRGGQRGVVVEQGPNRAHRRRVDREGRNGRGGDAESAGEAGGFRGGGRGAAPGIHGHESH